MTKAFLALIFFTFISLLPLEASNIKSRLFSQVTLMDNQLDFILEKNKLKPVFWQGNIQGFNTPNFSYYKTIQLFHKLNQYRMQKSYGAIALPVYPHKKILPQELYQLFKLFTRELSSVSGKSFAFKYHPIKNYNELYRRLCVIQEKLNTLISAESGTPTDVYNDAQIVLASITALRTIELYNKKIPMPKLKREQLPNDSLVAVQKLLQRIEKSKTNLWMKQSHIDLVPKRSIRPDDVSNALTKVALELEGIKQRLGLEYQSNVKPSKEVKSSSDVVQILEYARLMMPDFSLDHPIVQSPKTTNAQAYNKALSMAHFIQNKINQKESPLSYYRTKDPQEHLDYDHYYFLLEEAFDYLAQTRQKLHLKPTAHPVLPPKLTINVISRLLLRLDREISVVLNSNETFPLNSKFLSQSSQAKVSQANLSTLLYAINKSLKKRLGSSLTLQHLYTSAYSVHKQLHALAKNLHKPEKEISPKKEDANYVTISQSIVSLQKKLLTLEQRASFEVKHLHYSMLDETLTIDSLYHAMSQVKIVLRYIMQSFGMRVQYYTPTKKAYTLGDIKNELMQSEQLLTQLLSQ